jgi:hypothetical protein
MAGTRTGPESRVHGAAGSSSAYREPESRARTWRSQDDSSGSSAPEVTVRIQTALAVFVGILATGCSVRAKIVGWNVCTVRDPIIVGYSAWEIIRGPAASTLFKHCGEFRRVTIAPCVRNFFGDGCSTTAWSSFPNDRPTRVLRVVPVRGGVSTSGCVGSVELESDDPWLVDVLSQAGSDAVYVVELPGSRPAPELSAPSLTILDYAAIDWTVEVTESNAGPTAHVRGRIDVCRTRGLLMIARSKGEAAMLLDWGRDSSPVQIGRW